MAELTIRDWMVIIGVLLILAVLLDAWRRVYRERRSGVRLKLQSEGAPDGGGKRGDDLAWLKELPNGGARVVRRGKFQDEEPAELEAAAEAAPGEELPEQSAVERREAAAVAAAARQAQDAAREPEPEPEAELEPEPAPPTQPVDEPSVDEDFLVRMSAGRDEEGSMELPWEAPLSAAGEEPDEPAMSIPADDDPGTLPRSVDSEVFMLNVVARDPRGFKGEDILHILLACDLRFGDMNFFHRHEFEAGKGPIQFSVANMMRPGVFDIDNMGDFSTQGLVFFVTLPGPEDMMKAFDYMLETAQAVARNLGGDVLDESRSVLTRQALEHSRQQIRDLERRMLARARQAH